MAQIVLQPGGACAGRFCKMPSDEESSAATLASGKDDDSRRRELPSPPPLSRNLHQHLVASWHEHIYAAPPRMPTPHRISDILGWNSGLTSEGRVQGKLLAPTPRRFSATSPLIRAPLPIYSPLPASSPASVHTVRFLFICNSTLIFVLYYTKKAVSPKY